LEKILGPDKDAKPPEPPVKIELRQTPNDAVRAAWADLSLLIEAAKQQGIDLDTSGYRYIWTPNATVDEHACVSFVINSVISRSDMNYPPGKPRSPIQIVDKGRLVRINLRELCPLNKGKDFEEVAKVWDQMFNPYFLIEKNEVDKLDQIKQVLIIKQEQVLVRIGTDVLGRPDIGAEFDIVKFTDHEGSKFALVRYQDKDAFILVDGKVEIVDRKEQIQEIKVGFKTNVFGPHIDSETAALLQGAVSDDPRKLTVNPIVWCYSLYKGALTQIDGGQYYNFKGIRPASEEEKKKGLSDYDVFLISKGISEKLITELRADQRVAMIKSFVTGKPRRIDFFDRPARTSNNQGLIIVTQDVLDGDYDVKSDPFLNLLNFKVGGKELIYEENNGHLGFILFDGNGNLVDEAPPNLVSDHTIPAPYTKRLQPAISCIRCHGRPGDSGWKPFENHVRTALASFLNVYDDKGGINQKRDVPDTLETLARLYQGVLDKPIRRAREDHSDAIVICTGLARNAKKLPWQFEDLSDALAERFSYYDFTAVSPTIACAELGYVVEDEKQAVTLLNRLLGRLDPAIGVPVQREDVRLALLKQNIPINRYQWELVYVDAALRARRNTPNLNIQQAAPAAKPKD
jgi:hypothetical protein